MTRTAVVAMILISFTARSDAGEPSKKLSVAPKSMTIAGARGEVEKRNLLIEAEAPVSGIRKVLSDLVREDGLAVLPAEAVSLEIPEQNLEAGRHMSAPAIFNLANVPSGEFRGEIRIAHADGTASVPVTVRVRDPFWPPFLALLAGVSIGIGVSVYRSRGKPRDEILVRLGNVRDRLKADDKIAGVFRDRIKSCMMDAEDALKTEKFKESGESAGLAEQVMIIWRKNRNGWIELERRIGKMNPDSACAAGVRRLLADVVRKTPDEDPGNLEKAMQIAGDRVNRYMRSDEKIEKIIRLEEALSTAESDIWKNRISNLQTKKDALGFETDAEYTKFQEELSSALKSISEPGSGRVGERETLSFSSVEPEIEPVDAVESAVPVDPEPKPDSFTRRMGRYFDAQVRLKAFTFLTFLIAVGLLAGTGFGELYYGNPVFGANPWGDYFSLLAWGFGAEAGRDSITDMVRGWGLRSE